MEQAFEVATKVWPPDPECAKQPPPVRPGTVIVACTCCPTVAWSRVLLVCGGPAFWWGAG